MYSILVVDDDKKIRDEVEIYLRGEGLNMGADDYVVKPFNNLELLARVRSQLRRYQNPLTIDNKECIRIRDLVVDTYNKKVTIRGEEVKVTATEYKILCLFVSNPGRIFSIK